MVELIIEGVKADLSNDISGDITYSLADIRTPDKRQVNYTKTLTLEGTALNNYIFGNIFDIDVENDPIDPTLPNIGVNYTPKRLAKAQILSDGVQIFDGTLRLWKITSKPALFTTKSRFLVNFSTFFRLMGDKKLIRFRLQRPKPRDNVG
jgi:hypothetical protein